MSPELELKTLANTQATARHFSAFTGSLDSIVSYVSYSLGENAPPPNVLNHFLRLESTQRTLEAHFETALFKTPNNLWRLISLAPIVDIERAKRRLAERPPSIGTMCAWCWADAKGYSDTELKAEVDLKGVLTGCKLHRACERPWRQMRALVDSAETEER